MKKHLLTSTLSLALILCCSVLAAKDPVRGYMSHRGVHLRSTLAGENSLQAADYAKRAGFYCIETDTRYTSDSVLVVMHDAKLNRTCIHTDGSPLTEDVFVSDVSFEELRRDYRLKAARLQHRVQIPTLEEYLQHCRELGFTVFIEPKLKDSTGRFYLDIIKLADAVLGREGYVITSNNFANKVIRETLGIKDVRLMGLLYQTSWEEMSSLGNTIFALSTTGFGKDEYFACLDRALKSGYTVQTACCLLSHKQKVRFETTDRFNEAGKRINYVATDLAAPELHGQGQTLFSVNDVKKAENALSGCKSVEFGGIYVDMTFVGSVRLTVAGDSFTISSDPDKPRSISYRRMFFDSAPQFKAEAVGDGFSVKKFKLTAVEF